MPTIRLGRIAFLAAAMAVCLTQAVSPERVWAQSSNTPGVLAPHRAIYEITLDQARGGTTVSDMAGRMVYELTGSACDGYTQTMRFVTRMTNQDGATSLTDMRSTSWEDAVAKAFRFQSTQFKETKLEEQTKGDANREKFDSEGKIEITQPTKKQLALKSRVYFPIQHSVALLEAAQKGQPIFQADLFDGSEKGEKIYATTAYIGRTQAAGAGKGIPTAASTRPLAGMKSWPVSISYFDYNADQKDALPVYELAFQYFENGVSTRLFIDYVDFAVRGALKEITFLEPGKCEKTGK